MMNRLAARLAALFCVGFLHACAAPPTDQTELVAEEPPTVDPTVTVSSQMMCAPREAMVSALARQYGEQLRWVGLVSSGGVVELWANLETGRWSFIATNQIGLSCLMVHGIGATMQTEDQVAGLR